MSVQMPEIMRQFGCQHSNAQQRVKWAYVALFWLLEAPLYAEVIAYEAHVFPEEVGWTPNAFCDPERWVGDGWLFQHVQYCEGVPPPGGQRESFARSLGPFVGQNTFFVEWRMETDGDRSEIGGVAPASLVASGRTGVNYHFTIARDQVRLIRDNLLPIVFAETDPGIPHTYRLELHGDELYAWYIDVQIIDSGVPEGAYPTSETNVISFRAKSWYLESTTRWDYIRYGVIPEDGTGDYDSDAEVGLDDYYFFHECLTNRRVGINGGPGNDAGPGCRFADFDHDTDVDLHDFATFQNTFTGGN